MAQDIWKVVQTFAIADNTMRHKIELENHERRGEERTKPTAHTKPNVFDKINKGRIEPQVTPNDLTPLTRTRTEILTLYRDLLRLPAPLQAPPIRETKIDDVNSTKIMGITLRYVKTSCMKERNVFNMES